METTSSDGTPAWTDKNVVSVSCGLYACAHHMRAEARNGQYHETIVREELYPPRKYTLVPYKAINITAPNPTIQKQWDRTYEATNFTSEHYAFFPPCWENDTRHDRRPSDLPLLVDPGDNIMQLPPCAYGVSSQFEIALQSYISELIPGNCSVYVGGVTQDSVLCIQDHVGLDECIPCSSLGSPDGCSPNCATETWWLRNLYNSGNASFDSISAAVANLALAATDGARIRPYPNVRLVPGTVWESTVCTEFSWPWLCFPAVLAVLTILALVCVVSATGPHEDQPPIWKSSILPLLNGRVIGPYDTTFADSLDDMERTAKNDIMVLREGDHGWELRIIKEKDVQNAA
jgi:hypothetical protein